MIIPTILITVSVCVSGVISPYPTVVIVITDQYMEGSGGTMLGTDFVRILREKRGFEGAVIGWSGNGEIEAEYMEAGATLFWEKPPRPAQVEKDLRLALRLD